MTDAAPHPSSGSTLPRSAALTLIAFLAFGVVRRFLWMDQGAWIDEVLSLSMASGTPADIYERIKPQHMPLYLWILNPFLAVSDSVTWLRVPNILFGIAILPLVYRIGADSGRRRLGLTATALCAVSPFLIHYSQEIRQYGLMTLLGVLATWALVRIVHGQTRRDRVWGWVLLFFSSLTNLYASPFSGLVVFVHWAVLGPIAMARRELRLPYLGLASLAVAGFVPGILHILPLIDGSASVVADKTRHYDSFTYLVDQCMHHFAGLFRPLVWPMAVAGIFGAVLCLRRSKLLVAVSVGTFFFPLIAFFIVKPGHFFNPRYLAYAQPHLLLLCAATVMWLWDMGPGRWIRNPNARWVGPALLAPALLFFGGVLCPTYGVSGVRVDWREYAAKIYELYDRDSTREKILWVDPGWDANSLAYALDQVAPPGERAIFVGDKPPVSYFVNRRDWLEGIDPYEYKGPEFRLMAGLDLAELENQATWYRGQIFAISMERPRLLKRMGFEEVLRSPRRLPYSGARITHRPILFYMPAK